MNTRIYISLLFILPFFFSIPFGVHPAFAQNNNGGFTQIEVSSRNPEPNETVSVEASSFSEDLDQATISWFVNGQLRARGTGEKTFTFTLGASGSVSNITMVAVLPDGKQIRRSTTLRPASVVLLFEANTYTPPFYKGKALPTPQGTVTVTAVPSLVAANGARLNPANLIYTWSHNGQVLGGKSGVGKRTLTLEVPLTTRNSRVTVSVSSPNRAQTAEKGIQIPRRAPQLRLYEKHPVEGVRYNQELSGEIDLARDEFTIRAEPYFFSRESFFGNNLVFNWEINGQSASTQENQQELVVRSETEEAGNARLTLSVYDAAHYVQEATARVLFNIRESSNL